MSTAKIRDLLSDYLAACARANDFAGGPREPTDLEREMYRDALEEIEAVEKVEAVPVAKIEAEARRLIQDVLTSEAEVRAVATLADAVGANVDDLVPHEWIGRQP